jgi:hypothetical protein
MEPVAAPSSGPILPSGIIQASSPSPAACPLTRHRHDGGPSGIVKWGV